MFLKFNERIYNQQNHRKLNSKFYHMIILQHTCCIRCNSYDRNEARPARISAGASISVAKKPNKIKEKKVILATCMRRP